MSENKKKSWDYQKDRYKQINLKFNFDMVDDLIMYHYIVGHENYSAWLKSLVTLKMLEDSER